MPVTIGLVANVYQEINALPGWLECHVGFFDDVRVLHAGPGGTYSTDGTIELLKKWKIPVEFCAIDDGFGAVRTRALRMSPCEYVMILDADERFFPVHRVMTCNGVSTPASEVDSILRQYDVRGPEAVRDWSRISHLGADLWVEVKEVFDHGVQLRRILDTEKPDALCTIRRHWHDLSFRLPTQDWQKEPDWQLRVVRNDSGIYFDPDSRMHERLVGSKTMSRPDMVRGPFFDHFHFLFKMMEPDQRAHDVAIYDAVHRRESPPTWKQFRGRHDENS